MKKKTLISWSTGKDSAWMLHVLQQDPNIEVVGLFCTVNEIFNRVSMHGVRIELLQQQAHSINLPLHIVYIPNPCNNDEYTRIMTSYVLEAKKNGVEYIAFGDLFLENVRTYRENLLKNTGIIPLFPIWGTSTIALSKQIISKGFKAVVSCVNSELIASEFAGRDYDESFLDDIPKNVDPCGENGEFHTFIFEGPIFKSSIEITLGETVYRDTLCFKDILQKNNTHKR